MKVMVRKNAEGILSVYIAKKDLEEAVTSIEGERLWGGVVTLANGWRFEMPKMADDTPLPVTVDARRLGEG